MLKKNNILKMGYNKKKGYFAYLKWQILKNNLNQKRDVDILSVGVAGFGMMRV
jgi:hypothetical protein